MRWRNQIVVPFIHGELLDIGCGLNTLVRDYAGPGLGVDVFQWGSVDLVVEDTARLGLAEGRFGTVTMLACLNHIPNREAVLGEAFRVLAPGGKLVVTMIPPAISTIWHVLRSPWDDDQKERGMQEGEVYGIARAEIRRLLGGTGFRILAESTFMMGVNTLTVAEKPHRRR